MQWIFVKTTDCIVVLLNMNCKSTSFKIIKSTFWAHNDNLLHYFDITVLYLQWFFFFFLLIAIIYARRNKIFSVKSSIQKNNSLSKFPHLF